MALPQPPQSTVVAGPAFAPLGSAHLLATTIAQPPRRWRLACPPLSSLLELELVLSAPGLVLPMLGPLLVVQKASAVLQAMALRLVPILPAPGRPASSLLSMPSLMERPLSLQSVLVRIKKVPRPPGLPYLWEPSAKLAAA